MNIEKFTHRAKAYADGRPDYPQEVLDFILKLAPSEPTFADIGAGTGKFTQLLAQAGRPIFAVEPNDDMRHYLAQLTHDFPQIQVLDGHAEDTKIPDHSADIITVAQALHWFDPEAFRKECQRIAKPGALVISIYNITMGSQSHHPSDSAAAFFNTPSMKEFPHPLSYDRAQWLTYMASHSHSPLPDEKNYQDWKVEVEQIFDEQAVNGILTSDAITRLYWEQL